MNLTQQQSAAASADLDGVTKVVAAAGSGKTTMLHAKSLFQAKRGKAGLYLAFNKSAEIDASARFSKDWVTVKTINGLAHGVVSPRYRKKFRKDSIKSIEVIKWMGLSWNWGFARTVLDTYNFWCASDLYVFPKTAMSLSGIPRGRPEMLEYAAVVAKQLWERSISLTDEVPISHSEVLKVYQLSQPRLSYPYVMLDEGQDTNGVTWDILKRQLTPLVIVGDPYQSIYQFRGAQNALDDVVATQTFPLSQSFRFGKSVAHMANALLWGFYSETTAVEGLGPDTRIGPVDTSRPHTIISRTNATIFSKSVEAMQAGRKLGLVGGATRYNFTKIVDAWLLQTGQHDNIRDPFLREFKTFDDLVEYAEDANDMEVKRTIGAVMAYGSQVAEIVPAIHAACVRDLAKADITLSTAHVIKGASVSCVQIADDFPELIDGDGQMLDSTLLNRQEVNLLYVTLTRASHVLEINTTTLAFLESMEMDVSQFSRESSASVYHVVPELSYPSVSEPSSASPTRVPSAWLPASGEMPGGALGASYPDQNRPRPSQHSSEVRKPAEVKKVALPTRPTNQFDLFS